MIHHVTIQDLLNDTQHDLNLTLLAGQAGVARVIHNPRIQKPGLALAGYAEAVHPGRVQILGNTEMTYLSALAGEDLKRAVKRLFDLQICVAVITAVNHLRVPHELIAEAEITHTPLLQTGHMTANFIARVQNALEEMLQVATSVHGVLCDILGLGVLLIGKSGIGKSEAALELIVGGHRLIADDVVEIKAKGTDTVYGSGAELIRHHMEIRGIGIINMKEMFGVAAVRDRKKIELVIDLVEWDDNVEYERLGIDEAYYDILDVRVPKLTLPVRPGRNMAAIIEVAARNQLLKMQGYHAARAFQERLTEAITREARADQNGSDVE